MLTKDLRNRKLITATVRLERAKAVAKQAERAIARRDDAQAEVDWLRAAPIKDGESGEGLPTDDELRTAVAEKLGREVKADEQPTGEQLGIDVSVDGDEQPLI